MKKIISVITLVCVIVSTLSIGIYAIGLSFTTTRITVGGNSYILSNDALEDATNIDAEVAGYIAEFFVEDMIATATCGWDENTEVVDVITMYDENGEIPTAYTVELTDGYVVVAAYADVESLIPEWSDTSEPMIDELSETDDVIYLGGYEYFVDSGVDTVCDIYGNLVNKDDLVNYVEESRDISNLSQSVLENCVANPGITVLSDPIEDPYKHAEDVYGRINGVDEFVLSDYCNLWENYIYFYGYDQIPSGYDNCCVPICITNIVMTHKNKYNLPFSYYNSNFQSDDDVFRYIADYGISMGYFSNTGGTVTSSINNYIIDVLDELSVGAYVDGNYLPTYSNIRRDLNSGNILPLNLVGHPLYNAGTDTRHEVLCYAYTRLYNEYNGNYKTYLKIADGGTSVARYVDLATVITYDESTGGYVGNGCYYALVELWQW